MKFISSYSHSLEMVVYICMKAKSLVNLINDSMMDRSQLISRLKDQSIIHDFVVIGGGATGLGVAVDAATRGYDVVLFEQSDFAKGTSSRSTKLVHGGVRYLQQGDVALVLEALRERGLLKRNAPHLVHDQSFLIPCYRWWEAPFYTIGLILYDLMAGRLSLGRSFCAGKRRVWDWMPTLRRTGLKAGVVYHDGQFDDSRLALNLARTAIDAGACVVNYMRVTGLRKETGRVTGVVVRDEDNGQEYQVRSRCVINATGVFADRILRMDEPAKPLMVRPSQGVHLVLDASFLQSDHALMIPKTSDGRVLFAVPWHGKVVVGTTDTLMEQPELEPVALEKEIRFILDTAGKYLSKAPRREDVLSVFAGLRPLAAPSTEKKTKEISRSHKLILDKSGLITIIGGKWTTYRKMAEDTVNLAQREVLLANRSCVTSDYKIHGAMSGGVLADHLSIYGTDAELIRQLASSAPDLSERLHPDYPYTKGEIIWLIRNEMALTLEDLLARRLRILFLDARAALAMASKVAIILAQERGKDQAWADEQIEQFKRVAANYIL